MPVDTSKEQAQLMLRTMLADRFGLKSHWERKPLLVTVLEVSRGGAKLATAKNEEPPSKGSLPGKLTARAISMQGLADLQFRGPSHPPVIDQTGLTGVYDIDMKWDPDYEIPGNMGTEDLGFASALEKQLGLKLQRRKLLFDILVVDHADRVPTGN